MIVFVRALRIAVLCFFASFVSPAAAQRALLKPDIDLAASGFVFRLARQPDGGTIVAGSFASLGGLSRSGLARLKPDGTPDANWAPALPGFNISALAVDGSGNVYVGGGVGVVKILPGGDVDASFQASSDEWVEHIAPDGNGHVYVAGNWLAQIGDVPVAGIARLDANTGAVDTDWVLPVRADGQIRAIAADADALYVGGDFDAIGGQTRRKLAKLTNAGSVDASWNPAPDGIVQALAVDGTALYVGGYFAAVGGQPTSGLARVSRVGAGNADPDWRPASFALINSLALDGVGRIYASGTFSLPSNVYHKAGRFSVETAAMDPDWIPNANGSVLAFAADGAGVVIGGQFDRVLQSSRFGLAAFDANGTLLPATNTERAPSVWAVARHPDGGTIIGGNFHRAGAFERRYLARVTAAGDVDPSWDPSPNNQVQALSVDAAGSVYAGGIFSLVGGLRRDYLVKISNNGVVDPDWNPSPNFIIRAIERDADGSVYLGGAFTDIGGVPRARLAKLRPDGALDPFWTPGTDGEVGALELDGHGALFVGGNFAHAGGLERHSLAKLRTTGDGAVDATWNAPIGGDVSALAVDANDALYVGGYFSTVAGTPRDSFARIAADGSLDGWTPLPGGGAFSSSIVRSIVFDGTGRVYAGGALRLDQNGRFVWCGRFSADTGAYDEGWSVDADYEVSALAPGVGGTMTAAGGFTTIAGALRSGLAVLTTDDAIFANGFEQD